MPKYSNFIWFVVSIAVAFVAAYASFNDASRFASVVDLLATIISIMTGVSLAVIAVLVSPFAVSSDSHEDAFAAKRITAVVNNDDRYLATGQVAIFWLYFVTLLLALCFKWLTGVDTPDFEVFQIRLVASLAAFFGVFSFLWSARLPSILKKSAQQRRDLSNY